MEEEVAVSMKKLFLIPNVLSFHSDQEEEERRNEGMDSSS